MYEQGRGVGQDDAEAVKWYRLAAVRGIGSAQNSLGVKYVNGEGVGQDLVRAQMWFNLAGAAGNVDGTRNREALAGKMTPQQIAQAQKMVRECQRLRFKGCD